jgi:outer membrane protein assembly factor BamD
MLAEASINPRAAAKIAKKDTTSTQPPSVKDRDNQKIPY